MADLVLQTDFGRDDGAVAAMYGVAKQVAPNLGVFDLTHGIAQFNIWEGSYRLLQTVGYWPEGTVFVSVVDPGVGSSRRSVVAKTAKGTYIVTPDNGTLTHVAETIGLESLRLIDETVNRLPGSSESYTFHGRDVYAYTGARLAAGIIDFSQVGPEVPVDSIVKLPTEPAKHTGDVITGTIDIADVRYGNLWTNVPRELFQGLVSYGEQVEATISHEGQVSYEGVLDFDHFFAEVRPGAALIYVNSLDNIALAINQGNFLKAYGLGTGVTWKIEFKIHSERH
ncbi:MAG: S-adenosyl-l-methionine hydroxide adenosyltransferase family protein [Streptococcaceae bacterium]|nr:S-adenosyl-l-methionine hydroxide adenosyltransferase family protein [Streptococcaceae bacterium]